MLSIVALKERVDDHLAHMMIRNHLFHLVLIQVNASVFHVVILEMLTYLQSI